MVLIGLAQKLLYATHVGGLSLLYVPSSAYKSINFGVLALRRGVFVLHFTVTTRPDDMLGIVVSEDIKYGITEQISAHQSVTGHGESL